MLRKFSEALDLAQLLVEVVFDLYRSLTINGLNINIWIVINLIRLISIKIKKRYVTFYTTQYVIS